MRLVDVLYNQLHRLDQLAVIALDTREGPWPVIVVVHPRSVRQRDIGRRVVADQPPSRRAVAKHALSGPSALRTVLSDNGTRLSGSSASIGPGGMFDRLTQHAPVVELETIHRTKDPEEQRAWQALRAGEPERAMAHYQARGRLHLADTRDQAAENAVQTWAQLTEHHDIRQVALIADASNKEIDRLNARAQHLRAQRGELGPDELPLSSVHYGLRQGDHVAFIAQHRPPGQARVENSTRGEVTDISRDRTVTLALDGSGRTLRLAGEDVESLRLAYAQHVYRQQGATVDRAVVLTGGWQTSKETAYVQATRARHGTDWHLARDQLGEEGQDPDRITCLAQRMTNSRLQAPSTDYRELPDRAWSPTRDLLRLSNLMPHVGRHFRAPERGGLDRGR